MAQKPFAVVPEPIGTILRSTGYAGTPASHLGEHKHIGLVWRSPFSSPNPAAAAGDFGSARTIDMVSIIASNATPTTGVILYLADDPDLQINVFSQTSLIRQPPITRDDDLYHLHLEIPPTTRRYWGIEVYGHSGDFEASALVMGQRLTFTNYYSPGFGFGAEDLGGLELTRWGVPDEEDGLIFRRLDCTFGWMSRADMDDKFRPLVERLGKRGVALFCFDPEPTTYRQARTYFGWLRQPPFFRGAVNKFDRFESEWSILSMI